MNKKIVKKIASAMLAAAIAFVSLPALKPAEANAWCWPWQREVEVIKCQYVGTVYTENGVEDGFDVTFIDLDDHLAWRTRPYYGVRYSYLSPYFDPWTVELFADVTVDKSLLNNTNLFIEGTW